MMHWIFLTLIAIVSRAFLSITTKVLSIQIKITSVTLSVVLTFMGGVFGILTIPFFGLSFNGFENYLLPITIMITSQAFGNILYFAGLKRLDSGIAQIVLSSVLIWGSVLSVIFLDSSFSLLQIAGIILLLFSILLVQYQKGTKKIDVGILYILIAAALFAVFQISSADLSKQISTSAYLLLAYFGPTLFLSIIYYKTVKKDISVLLNDRITSTKYILMSSVASFGYFIFSYSAYQKAPDRGLVVVLLTLQVILSVLLGLILLRERKHVTRKIIAALLAFISAILII